MMRRTVLPKQSRRRLGIKHAVHVQAAEYWLALGKLDEADRELQRIQLSRRNHPDVQRVREEIQRAARARASASVEARMADMAR
jgi:hypothetical protein